MKLLIVKPRFSAAIGGGETYVRELMRHFSRRGLEVHLLTGRHSFNTSTWEGCSIHAIDGFDSKDVSLQQATPQFYRALERVKPDVVHIHNLLAYWLHSSLTSPGQYPTILTIHASPDLPQRLFGTFQDAAAETAFCKQLLTNGRYDKLLFGSSYYVDSYLKAVPEIARDKIDVAHYFPAQSIAGPVAPRQHLPSSIVRVLFPSRLVQHKGIEDCLRAMKELPSNYCLDLPAFHYRSSAMYHRHINALIRELGLKERIIYPKGATTINQMATHYKRADVAVIPSHFEGFGIVAVEALSWGLPVVTTGVGGLGEIIADNENGIVVAPHSPSLLAEGIRRAAEDTPLRSKITSNGLKTVRKHFSYTQHMNQIERIYNEILRTNREPARQ